MKSFIIVFLTPFGGFKSKNMISAGHVARTVYVCFPLERFGGRLEDNIKIDLKERGVRVWTRLN
jgi:hypothetical protein